MLRFLVLLWVGLLRLDLAICYGGPRPNVVDLGYAKYQGVDVNDTDIVKWLGMRYAKAPLGDLRWRAPVQPDRNNAQTQSAADFGATCVGSGSNLSEITSEDCLFLNVWAPKGAGPGTKLPVWFFIQGGGYASNSDQNFLAADVIKTSNHSMVFVQINYRVGAFGFLASDKIRQNGDLNVGLLDQRFALHWAQKYIHLFGGDPDHVVIHGDSAGAGSIAHQLTAYSGRDDGLFVGAMAESPFWPTHRQVGDVEFQFDLFAKNLSCPCTAEEDVLKCLRSKTTEELQASDVILKFPEAAAAGDWYWLPVVDGNFSTDLLYRLFGAGKVVRVPLVVGDDTDEGTVFVPDTATDTEFLGFMKNNYPKLSNEELQLINQTYPQNDFGTFAKHEEYFPATAAAYGEATFVCPGIEMSQSLADCHSPSKVWNYRYNVQDQDSIAAGLGVTHVSEKQAIFGASNTNFGPCNGCSYETYNKNIVPVLMSYWISFIVSLDPNTHKVAESPVWHPWRDSVDRHPTSSPPQRIKLQTNATVMEAVPRAQLQRCSVWRGLADSTEQ